MSSGGVAGNSKTSLIVACSPHLDNIEETISTLRFAQRAKTIKNKVTCLRSALYSSPAKIEHSPADSNGSFNGKTRHSTNYGCVFRYLFEL